MKIDLTLKETRIIGCLIEKEITTPDQYPLSLNALTNACNQKSNRDPVMDLQQSEVQSILDELGKKFLVNGKAGYGSRVEKYKHCFCNVGFGSLDFTTQERGIICALFLRGPQTPGELRTHTQRLCHFNDVHETEAALENLLSHSDGPFVVKLPREPGKRESRYDHCFCSEIAHPEPSITCTDTAAPQAINEESRIDQLETEVAALRAELEALKEQIC